MENTQLQQTHQNQGTQRLVLNLKSSDIESLAQVALRAAQTAARYIQSQVTQSQEIQYKESIQNLATQVVTATDIESQRLILAELKPTMEQYDLGLLTEELADDGSRFQKDYFWCIDPLDGTLPFTEQKSGYAVSIALISQAGDPIIGVVSDPYHSVHWLAIRGRGVWKNGALFEYQQRTHSLICQLDRSFLESAAYTTTVEALQCIIEQLGYDRLEIRSGYGAVMNALSLLDTGSGCYVKWPKGTRGGGCLWDYAATRVIFEELNLPVSTAAGTEILLNQKEIYLHTHGILYATHINLHKALIEAGKRVNQ